MKLVEVQGMTVPALGLGTWRLSGQDGQFAIEKAITLGYRHIDTAQMYENEAKVGGALRATGVPRDEFFVTTKLAPDHLREDAVLRSTHESLRRLGLDFIDLMLIHWPSTQVSLEETLGAMLRTVEEGSVRFLGLSNFPPRLVEEALRIAPIHCVQVEYHTYLGQRRLHDLCRRRNLLLTAYTPLARGKVSADPVLREIGARYEKTASQIALRWLVQQENVAAIPKASSETHLRSNLEIFDFELTSEEMHRIFELERGERLIDPSWAPDWDAA